MVPGAEEERHRQEGNKLCAGPLLGGGSSTGDGRIEDALNQ